MITPEQAIEYVKAQPGFEHSGLYSVESYKDDPTALDVTVDHFGHYATWTVWLENGQPYGEW